MKHNILDIKGLKVGQAQNTEAKTGVTVVIAEKGAVCGVDVLSMPWKEYRLLSFPAVPLLVWRLPAVSWTIWKKKASALT